MDYQLTLDIVLLLLEILSVLIILLAIYYQKFSFKFTLGLVVVATCLMILLLIFYVNQFDNWSRISLVFLSVSSLIVLLFFVPTSGLMMFCQRNQNQSDIEAENQENESNKLFDNAEDKVQQKTQRIPSKSDCLKVVDYPIAVSNRLFKSSEILKDLPCQNCNLISMGSMACYQLKCPQCGNTPPNRTPV